MARGQKCKVCQHEFVDGIEALYEQLDRKITHLSDEVQERFSNSDSEIPGYSSLRRHFKNHYNEDIQRSNIVEEVEVVGVEDISEQEMSVINMQIEAQGIANLSMEDIVKNTKYNKKKSKESAASLKKLLPRIEEVYETAETDKTRLDCLKMMREITMSINRLETEYIQTELKTKEVMQRAKDDEESKEETIFKEDFQKAMIIFSRKIKDNMYRIEEKEVKEVKEDGDQLPSIAALE